MVDYRKILRLQSLEHNITQIVAQLPQHRKRSRTASDSCFIRKPLEDEVTNSQIYVLLYSGQQQKVKVYLNLDCAWINRELV